MTSSADDTVHVLASTGSSEERIKHSRFVGRAFPVEHREEANQLVARLREEEPDATHHCFAYRTGPNGSVYRVDDDGEPRGTAGQPILRQIDSFSLVNALVVVTRYYGGTKLGTGGLIRAYGSTARSALESANIEKTVRKVTLSLLFDYDNTAAVESVLNAFQAVTLQAEYAERVKLVVSLALKDESEFSRALVDATSGRITVESMSA